MVSFQCFKQSVHYIESVMLLETIRNKGNEVKKIVTENMIISSYRKSPESAENDFFKFHSDSFSENKNIL